MNEKKQRLIEEGMKLFALKGFHSTSIQEIADQCGMSKGSFYLHFQSKEDLILSIFTYYFENIRDKVAKVATEQATPRQLLEKQLSVYLDDFFDKKEFIIMQFRENFAVNEKLDSLMREMRASKVSWFEKAISRIYGESIGSFLTDATILLAGLLDSYLKVLLFSDTEMDLHKISAFIVRRLDDLVSGLQKEQEPLFTKVMFGSNVSITLEMKSEVKQLLEDAEQIALKLQLEDTEKRNCLTTVQILKKEIAKDAPEIVVFQGMLSNFKNIAQLKDIRSQVAKRLGISLI